jgi:large subunit ribosomal protein L24
MLIRTGDTVVVIAGNGRILRQQGRVIKVDRDTGKALVEGVNRVKKHIRRSQKYPQGGVLSKEMPVQLSNVQFFCQSCGRPTRLGARFLADGSKERFCKKCGASAGQVAPAKAAHAANTATVKIKTATSAKPKAPAKK